MHGDKKPVFSAVICTHDRPGYLKACLDGLSRQTEAFRFETLVVDSATPPERAPEIANLVRGLPGARLIRTERPGLSIARNTGFRAAQTPWAVFLDDDAVPEDDWAARMAARIAVLPDQVAVIGGRIRPRWEAELPAWWPQNWVGALTILDEKVEGYVGETTELSHIQPYGANIAFRISVLEKFNGFPEELGRVGERLLSSEESFVYLQIMKAGYKVFYDGGISVHHSIQANRLLPAWIMNRVYWQGISDAAMKRLLGQGISARLKALRMLARNAHHMRWLRLSENNPDHLDSRCAALYALGYLRGSYSR